MMDRNLRSSPSVIDIGDVEDIGNMFEKLVSRQSKFTLEFEKNMEICCTQLKNLISTNDSKNVQLINSLYNVELKASGLMRLQEEYEKCSVCKNVRHAPLRYGDDSPDKVRRRPTEISAETFDLIRPIRSTQASRFFFDFKTDSGDSPKPSLRKEASHVFNNHGISDYFVFLVNQRESVGTRSFVRPSMAAAKELCARGFEMFLNFFPLFNITNFTNLIIVVQWVLYLARVLVYRKFFHPGGRRRSRSDIEAESTKFGAFSGDLLRNDLEVYRLLTATFFHNSFAHLVISTMMHLRFSSVFEKINGIVATIFVYLLSSAYGMIGVCWIMPKSLQASGFAGDWGVAGALLSRFFLFPYLVHREYQNITNVIVSYICLFFLKTIGKGSSVLVSAHLLSAVSGLCMGTMINIRSKTNKVAGLKKLMVDFLCSFVLLAVPIFSVFMLFQAKLFK